MFSLYIFFRVEEENKVAKIFFYMEKESSRWIDGLEFFLYGRKKWQNFGGKRKVQDLFI